MSNYSAKQIQVSSQGDGPTLTAAAAATCLAAPLKFPYPGCTIQPGTIIRAYWAGRISCVVTTPGTARFDLRMGSGNVVWDSGALNLNVVAKTNVPFLLELELFCRAIGSSSTLLGIGQFTSEAVVGAAANTAGGNGVLLCPVGAPVVGTAWDSTIGQQVDSFFTQTVATGSMTVHNFSFSIEN